MARAAMPVPRKRAIHLLNILGLGERITYLPIRLSGGEVQRVAIARALLPNLTAVSADESTGALDRHSSLLVVRMLIAIGRERGATALMVTHDDRIHHLADEVQFLRDRRMVAGAN